MSFSFYKQNYSFCHNWLVKNGFHGLMAIDLIFAQHLTRNFNQIEIDDFEDQEESEDIDSDYLKAIEITRKHQNKMKQHKQALHNPNDDLSNYIDFSQTETYSTNSKAPLDERKSNRPFCCRPVWYHNVYFTPCQIKLAKYRKMYSSDNFSATIKNIIQIENDLEYNFESFCDRHQPKFWPVLPVKIYTEKFE